MDKVTRSYQVVADIWEVEVPVGASDEEIVEYIGAAIEKGIGCGADVLKLTEWKIVK